MKKTKTTPAAEPAQIQQEAPNLTLREAKNIELKRQFESFRTVIDMFSGIESDFDFRLVQTVLLIMDRDQGCVTPIKDFLQTLLLHYWLHDADGKGLTVEDIEHEVDQLKDNLRGTIETAHFIADRYPRPEPEQASNQ